MRALKRYAASVAIKEDKHFYCPVHNLCQPGQLAQEVVESFPQV